MRLRAAALSGALVLGAVIMAAAWSYRPEADIGEGRQLYLGYCAGCHGAKLEGQPDWQTPDGSGRLPAPPHDAGGHSWHHSDQVLFDITKYGTAAFIGGGYQSDMPGFAEQLSDGQIMAVLDYIKSTWPEAEADYQRNMTAREAGTFRENPK